jgi:hypothetical protein
VCGEESAAKPHSPHHTQLHKTEGCHSDRQGGISFVVAMVSRESKIEHKTLLILQIFCNTLPDKSSVIELLTKFNYQNVKEPKYKQLKLNLFKRDISENHFQISTFSHFQILMSYKLILFKIVF